MVATPPSQTLSDAISSYHGLLQCCTSVMQVIMGDESPEARVTGVVSRLLTERSLSPAIQPDDDLRVAGLTSLDMISLVLAVEAEFGLLVPETHIKPDNFQSVAAISGLVTVLLNVG